MLTTVITLVPRYILINKLPCQLRVSQFNSTQSITLDPNQRVAYNFKTPVNQLDKKIVIGDAADKELPMSRPFLLEDIADFQIPYRSQAVENPKWHEPKGDNASTRCVRVVVTSQDEATLFAYFQEPEMPEYTINNGTMEFIHVELKDTEL